MPDRAEAETARGLAGEIYEAVSSRLPDETRP